MGKNIDVMINRMVVVFNFDHSEFEKVNLMKAGVNALLPAETDFSTFLILLRDLKPFEVYFNRLVDKDFVSRIKTDVIENINELTMQEISFIRDRCNGIDNAAIAKKSCRSGSRIDNVFHDIRVKTGCETQIDFIRFAMLHKIIDWGALELRGNKKADMIL